MNSSNYENYLKQIGNKINLNLEFDSNNLCEISINEDDAISVVANPEDHNLIFTTAVAIALPDPVSYSVVLDLFDLGLGPVLSHGGNSPVIGRDPDTEAIILYQVNTESILESSDVGELFLDFFKFKQAIAQHLKKVDSDSKIIDSEPTFLA